MGENIYVYRGILIFLVLIVFALCVFIVYDKKGSSTGSVTCESGCEYSYTTAVCNNTNYCQDYEVVCKGNNLVRMEPIVGAVIQQNDEWQDPRSDFSKFCEIKNSS